MRTVEGNKMGKQILTILAVLSLVVAGVVIVTTTCDNNTGTDAATKIVYIESDSSDVDRAKAYIATEANNYITSDDVKRTEVLKDASATAIYGEKEGNGVILITVSKDNVKAMDDAAKKDLIATVNGFIGHVASVLYVMDMADAGSRSLSQADAEESYLPAADSTAVYKDRTAAATKGPVVGTSSYKDAVLVGITGKDVAYSADNVGLVIPADLNGRSDNAGVPGMDIGIRIRGAGSMTGTVAPLVVIDGIYVTAEY